MGTLLLASCISWCGMGVFLLRYQALPTSPFFFSVPHSLSSSFPSARVAHPFSLLCPPAALRSWTSSPHLLVPVLYQPQEALELGRLVFHKVLLQLAEGGGEDAGVVGVAVRGFDQIHIHLWGWWRVGN